MNSGTQIPRKTQGPQVVPRRIRTRSLVRLDRLTACPRIMFFHSSCGSPNSAAGVVCGGIRPACPTLWGRRRSQKSRCRAILIRSIRALMAILRKPKAVRTPANKRLMQQADRNPIAIPWRELWTMLPTSPRTMCSPLLCAPHNKGEGVVRR